MLSVRIWMFRAQPALTPTTCLLRCFSSGCGIDPGPVRRCDSETTSLHFSVLERRERKTRLVLQWLTHWCRAMSEAAEFDSPWKEVVRRYLRSLLRLCFPKIERLIDWSRTPEFLDKELQKIVRD